MKDNIFKVCIFGIILLLIGNIAVSGMQKNFKTNNNLIVSDDEIYISEDTVAYTITDLGTLSGYSEELGANAMDINNFGSIVGSANIVEEWWPDPLWRAYLYSEGAMTDIGTLDNGTISEAWSINELGQIVGYSEMNRFSCDWHAFLWDDEGMIDLETLGGPKSQAHAINNKGQIVGSSNTNLSNFYTHAFLWENGTMVDLGTLGGDNSLAWNINDYGQVVGSSFIDGFGQCAFLWLPEPTYGLPAGMNNLGTLGGEEPHSEAKAINNQGQVVGKSQIGVDFIAHAFLWENGTMIDLTPENSSYSIALSINNHGQIVGGMEGAILWQNDVLYDLNELIPEDSGWFLVMANDINDIGQIIGYGIREDYNEYHAFLLTPVDDIPPIANIAKPLNEIYVRNQKIMPFFFPLIIGEIDIEVDAMDNQSEVQRIEFFIDGYLKANITQPPYIWTWNEKAFFRHTITVIAYDNANNNISKEVSIIKFF